jgi:integrase
VKPLRAPWVPALKVTGERLEYLDEMLPGLVLRIEPSVFERRRDSRRVERVREGGCGRRRTVSIAVLTGQSGGELHGATWDEDGSEDRSVDHSSRASQERACAQSTTVASAAVRILKPLTSQGEDSAWVFPSRRKACPHINHAQKAIERIVDRSGVQFRGHDC